MHFVDPYPRHGIETSFWPAVGFADEQLGSSLFTREFNQADEAEEREASDNFVEALDPL